jgi:hypothetical protein
MRGLGFAVLVGAMACASQPGRDGPATPTTSDTVAVAPGSHPSVIGFAEVSRRAYAEGCETSRSAIQSERSPGST